MGEIVIIWSLSHSSDFPWKKWSEKTGTHDPGIELLVLLPSTEARKLCMQLKQTILVGLAN